MNNSLLFILAGEKSGDALGKNLIRALKKEDPSLSFIGVPGPEMEKEGVTPVARMEDFSVMGFSDVLLSLPRLFSLRRLLLKAILKKNPSAVILIDYVEFNLNLAKTLRKRGYSGKIIQYVSPTVWAWREKRTDTLAAHYDLLLTLYPFEKKAFSHTSLPVFYAGNPVKKRVEETLLSPDWSLSEKNHPIIALFPGSRQGEIARNLPKQLATAEILHRRAPQTTFALSLEESTALPSLLAAHAPSLVLNDTLFVVPPRYAYEMMHASRAALAKSGTVTLELALMGCPTVSMYELSPLNHFIAKQIIRLSLKHYCIVNILSEETIFPEFYDKNLSPSQMAEALYCLAFDSKARGACLAGCERVAHILGDQDADTLAAKEVLHTLSRKKER